MGLFLHPMTLKEACRFVREHHRHHKPPQGGLFAIGCAAGDVVCGVVIVGRPVARHLDDSWTAEITRCCTNGTRNACSFLYAAAWRAAKAIGYRRLITYTRADEPGSSLRGAGWKVIGESRQQSWDRPSRPRVDKSEPYDRLLWEAV